MKRYVLAISVILCTLMLGMAIAQEKAKEQQKPDKPPMPTTITQTGEVLSVDKSPQTELSRPLLASIHGGAIDVKQGAHGALVAQDAWPVYTTGSPNPHFIQRGPGSYFALWKLVLLALVVWAWVKSADWNGRYPIFLR